MSDFHHEVNVIDLLREKTEQIDLKKCLKPTIGGYSRKSVLNYLSLLKKQQQETANTFQQNIKMLFEEKEGLKDQNQDLREKFTKAENDYKNLYESIRMLDLEDKNYSVNDVIELRKIVSAKESEIYRINEINRSLNKEIDELHNVMKELTLKLEQSKQETQTQKDLLVTEKMEMKKLREQINDLTNSIADQRDEIKYLKETMSQANINEMQGNISSLLGQVSTQSEIIEKIKAENSLEERTIETLTGENESIKQNINSMTKAFENLQCCNDKLISANRALKTRLEEEYKKEIALINEKSDAVIEKLAAQKKYEEANAKISLLEMKFAQYKKREESGTSS